MGKFFKSDVQKVIDRLDRGEREREGGGLYIRTKKVEGGGNKIHRHKKYVQHKGVRGRFQENCHT